MSFKKIGFKILLIIILVFGVYLIIPFEEPFFDTDYSLVIKDESGNILRVFLNKNEQWSLPPEDSIKVPFNLIQSILYFEDQYFRWHPGINPVSIVRAAYQNIQQKKVVSGASTITMQIARIRNPKKRTFFNKIREIIEAFRIELHYSKNEILDFYLTHAPYGGNIIGYRAASYRYFGKTPSQLSWAESATLAVLPNAPGNISPGSNHKILLKKRNFLLRKLFNNNVIDSTTYELALLEPLPNSIFKFKMLAPHLTQKIYKNHHEKIINTTINSEIQEYSENLCLSYMRQLNEYGIHNCAAIIVDNTNSQVKAYIGSQNFFDFKNNGQVDGVMASRSSGSILKPFLYGLAIDDGIILPQTLIKDIPTYFNAFSPNNADEKFNGIVPAKEALVRSLNIPAVRLLNSFGVYPFYAFLKEAGISTLFRTSDEYGLPLIIGGAEVTLWEMASMYKGLTKEGYFSKNYYLKGDSKITKQTSSQLISPGACYLVFDMLKELNRPATEYFWQQFTNQKYIAWKTGTSYGHKDAWAIGTTPKWTVGVWVGNFSGEGNVNLSGVRSAGPLMFELFNYLSKESRTGWFEKPEMDLSTVKLCAQTGFLAGPYCDSTIYVDAPQNMKPLRLCPYHKNIFVNKTETYAVCSNCWDKDYHSKHILVYPADVLFYLKKRGVYMGNIPIHNPACTEINKSNQLSIIYPVDSARIWLPRDYNGELQNLVAKAASSDQSKNVFWFIDDVYLGITSEKHRKTFQVSKGWHNLLVSDENGNEDKVRFYVNVRNE